MDVKDNRGVIVNREYAQLIADFSGMRFERNITPTDLDMMVEFGGELFILAEFKYKDTPVKPGQRKAMERIIDAISRGQSPEAVAFITEHDITPESGMDIPAAQTIVREVYWSRYKEAKEWRPPNYQITLRDAVNFIKNQACCSPGVQKCTLH